MSEIPELTIEAEHLVKTYGSLTAVNDLTFTVRRGEIMRVSLLCVPCLPG